MSKNEKISEEQFFESGKVIKNGVEWPESTPVELPIGYQHPPSITEMIATMVRQEMQMREEMNQDVDEAEREEDFAMDEDGEEELLTPYELHAIAAQEKEALVREGARQKRKPVPPAKQAEGLLSSGGKESRERSGATDGQAMHKVRRVAEDGEQLVPELQGTGGSKTVAPGSGSGTG